MVTRPTRDLRKEEVVANGVTKEEESKRVEFTMAMDSDRLQQCETFAKTKGVTRTALMRVVIYEWLDAQLKLTVSGPAR